MRRHVPASGPALSPLSLGQSPLSLGLRTKGTKGPAEGPVLSPVEGLSFTRPNLPVLIAEIEGDLLPS